MSAPMVLTGMGPAERAVYRARHRGRAAFAASEAHDVELPVGDLSEPADLDDGSLDCDVSDIMATVAAARGQARFEPPVPVRIAAELMLARTIDSVPDLSAAIRAGAVVLIDVADRAVFEEIRFAWPSILLGPNRRVAYLDRMSFDEHRAEYSAVALVRADPPKARDSEKIDAAVVRVLSWGMPVIGLSPSAAGHMPSALLAAARHRLVLPPIGVAVLARTIELVTGQRCRPADVGDLANEIAPLDLAIALRYDRTPTQCIDELRRLQAERARKRGARELTLDQLHGLEPAVKWARGLLADLAAWRRGEISWGAVDHGAVLDGPPGTGKTLFAQVLAAEAKLPFISGSLAKWQSNGHMGDLLKAMRADFNMALARAPAVTKTMLLKLRTDLSSYLMDLTVEMD